VAGLFAAADLFVCPSRHEPLGNVVIEAWAQGISVIAAASEGPRQLITDGEDGLLVPVDAPEPMGQAIARLLAEPDVAARLGAAGRQAYERTFTEDAVVACYLDFFAKVAR